MGEAAAEQRGVGLAVDVRRRMHLGQQAARDAQRGQQLVVPLVAVDVEQHRARGVGDVGDVQAPAGELPHQPAVHRAEGQFAALGALAHAGHVVEDPLDLGAGEIGIDHQAGLLAHQRLQALRAQRGADRLGAAVLPDDGVVDRHAGAAVPQHRGLALVGDAQRGDVVGLQAGFGEHLARGVELAAPDLARVVLDPAGLGIDLAEFALRHRDEVALRVEDDAARAGGSLVEGEQVGHR